MQISIDFPEEIVKNLKYYAALTGKSVAEIIIDSVERTYSPYLADDTKSPCEGRGKYLRDDGTAVECVVLRNKSMFGEPYYVIYVQDGDQLLTVPQCKITF